MKDIFPKIYLEYPVLHKAVDDDKITDVIGMIFSGCNPNELNESHETPLMLA